MLVTVSEMWLIFTLLQTMCGKKFSSLTPEFFGKIECSFWTLKGKKRCSWSALYLTHKSQIFNRFLRFIPTQDTEALWKTFHQRSSTTQPCQSPTTHPGSRPSVMTRPWPTLSSLACPKQSPNQIYQVTKVSTGNNHTDGPQVTDKLIWNELIQNGKFIEKDTWLCYKYLLFKGSLENLKKTTQ